MTAPAQPVDQPDQLSAAQIATLLALVKAQAAVRQQLTQAASAAALAAMAGFTAWWDAEAVTGMIADVLRVVQPLQRQAATITDGYLTRAATIISGRPQRAAGTVEVRALRRAMTEELADQILAGVRQAVRVELGGLSDQPSRDVQESPNWGLEDGREALDPAEVYGRVADGYRYQTAMVGDSPDKAQIKAAVRIAAVAETDVTLAVRAQYQKTMDAQGATGWRRILHPELSKTGPCGLCVVAADRVYKSADLLPLHNRCVPEGTRVAADNVLGVTRRNYTGSLVVLLTASGQEMTITANHPVLTDQGWIPAHLVDERHHVVRHRRGHGVAGRGPAEYDRPPLVEDVWRAATVDAGLDLRTVPLAPEDFHGDWSKGEVEVVSTDRNLPRIGDISFGDPRRELLLEAGHRLGVGSATGRDALEAILRLGNAASSGVRGGGNLRTLLAGGAGVEQLNRLGLAARFDSGFLEPLADRAAVNAVVDGELELRDTVAVLLDDLGVRELLTGPTRFDPAFADFTHEGRGTYARLGRSLRERLAGDVELDRIVEHRRVEGTHHVYNLHTAEGWYSANSLIVSNCVCEVLPVYGRVDPGITLNGDDLAALYEAAGGNTREQLRRISVVLTEHGELGPILVYGDQHYRDPVQVARNYASSRAVRERAILDSLEQQFDITKLRVSRGDPLERTLKSQQARIDQLRQSLGVSAS